MANKEYLEGFSKGRLYELCLRGIDAQRERAEHLSADLVRTKLNDPLIKGVAEGAIEQTLSAAREFYDRAKLTEAEYKIYEGTMKCEADLAFNNFGLQHKKLCEDFLGL